VHTRKLGALINVPSKNVFARIEYTSFQIRMSPGKCCTKEIWCVHRLWKIRGNIGLDPCRCIFWKCL